MNFSNNDDSHKMLRRIHKRTIYMHDMDENDDNDGHDMEEEEEEASKQTSSGMSAYVMYVRKVIEKYLLYVDPEVNQEEATLGIKELVMQAVKVARKIHTVGRLISHTKPFTLKSFLFAAEGGGGEHYETI